MASNEDECASVDDLLPVFFTELDRRFRHASREWDLVKRNKAITARNRNMKVISEMLGMEYHEMPLEQAEDAA